MGMVEVERTRTNCDTNFCGDVMTDVWKRRFWTEGKEGNEVKTRQKDGSGRRSGKKVVLRKWYVEKPRHKCPFLSQSAFNLLHIDLLLRLALPKIRRERVKLAKLANFKTCRANSGELFNYGNRVHDCQKPMNYGKRSKSCELARTFQSDFTAAGLQQSRREDSWTEGNEGNEVKKEENRIQAGCLQNCPGSSGRILHSEFLCYLR